MFIAFAGGLIPAYQRTITSGKGPGMHIRSLLALIVLIAVAGIAVGFAPRQTQPSARPAETFKIDSVHSTALYRVHHLGAGQFWGRFNDISGTFRFAEGSESDLSFDIEIDINSVDTNNDKLNNHLKSPDFFNAVEHPKMTFKSASAAKVGEKLYRVTGDLTIRGITKRITAEIEWTGSNETGPGGYRCGFEARFTINRSDFNVSYGVDNGMVGNETKVIVGLEGVRQ
jgi:polyisoprenoid-binding protein YceI